MTQPTPFVRRAGTGPTVLCLHSNASHSGQWAALMELLAPDFHVVAPDLYGAGKSPQWPSSTTIGLADEIALIAPLLEADGGVHLVGHSYGAAVALKAALMHPARVRSLALYEPTLFGLVDQAVPQPNGTQGIATAIAQAAACLDRGDDEGAARAFIDYWMGPGSLDAMPPARRPLIVQACRDARRWAHALTQDPATLADVRALTQPVLYLLGERSPVSAHAVAEVLVPALAHVQVAELPGLGHMAPVTHPGPVNERFAAFLRAQPR